MNTLAIVSIACPEIRLKSRLATRAAMGYKYISLRWRTQYLTAISLRFIAAKSMDFGYEEAGCITGKS